MTISLAAVFLVKIRACRVKNARKMSNLAALFSLQARIFPQKTASQAECQQPLALPRGAGEGIPLSGSVSETSFPRRRERPLHSIVRCGCAILCLPATARRRYRPGRPGRRAGRRCGCG
ncbi:hypothetical protein CGZ77_00155 [Neisseria sp. KEM232]|nr:hypothetical protein CGZ77_00155 [Neisseria sp. KEM232]